MKSKNIMEIIYHIKTFHNSLLNQNLIFSYGIKKYTDDKEKMEDDKMVQSVKNSPEK